MSDSVVFDDLVVSSAKDLGHEPIQHLSGKHILDNRWRIDANRFMLFCNKRNSLRSLPQSHRDQTRGKRLRATVQKNPSPNYSYLKTSSAYALPLFGAIAKSQWRNGRWSVFRSSMGVT